MRKARLGKLQRWIVCDLYLKGNINKREMYKKGYSYSAVSLSLKSLKKKGLITSNTNILELTKEGRTAVELLDEEA